MWTSPNSGRVGNKLGRGSEAPAAFQPRLSEQRGLAACPASLRWGHKGGMAMKEICGGLLAAILAGCQSMPSRVPASHTNPTVALGLEVEQRVSGLTAMMPVRRDVTCPTSCHLTMTPNVIIPLVYDGSGVDGPQPGWPDPPDGPGNPTPPHDDAPGGYKFCELYALRGDMYLCGKEPQCPGQIFSPKNQKLLEVTMTTFGATCSLTLFKPYVVKPVTELTLVAGTKFVPLSPPPPPGTPPPPAPTYPHATLQVREHFLNAPLVTVQFPQILRVDNQGYLVGSLSLFSAPTQINVALRGSNPKGEAELRFTINLVPAGKDEEL